MDEKWKTIFGLLILITISVWIAFLSYPEPKLRIIACDVGQGDAIVVTKGRNQILIDGGPGRSVLECLNQNMPFWDREIEVVVLTHPQEDHFGGLVEVFRRYNVQVFLASPLDSGSQGYQVLKSIVGGSTTKVVNAATRQNIRLGSIYLDIVWPTSDYLESKTDRLSDSLVLGAVSSKQDANDFSVVLSLRFKDFDALFTGDIGPSVIDDVLATGRIKDVEYLKVPHHGSKNGLTLPLLEKAKPEVAVISVGEKNRYGHPHKEILEMLSSKNVLVERTDQNGYIIVESSGKEWSLVD